MIIAPSLALELLLGLGLALLLGRVIHGRPVITALLAIPAMVSPVMGAMAWRMMYGVKYGAINNLLVPGANKAAVDRLDQSAVLPEDWRERLVVSVEPPEERHRTAPPGF